MLSKCFPLEEYATLSSPEEIAGNKTKNQATEVPLPSYAGDKGEYNKTTDYRYPEGYGYRYRDYNNPEFGSHYGKRPAESKDSPGGPNGDTKRRCQQYEENVTQYTAAEIDGQKPLISNQP